MAKNIVRRQPARMPPRPTNALATNPSRRFGCRRAFGETGGNSSGVDRGDWESGLVSLKVVDFHSYFNVAWKKLWYYLAVLFSEPWPALGNRLPKHENDSSKLCSPTSFTPHGVGYVHRASEDEHPKLQSRGLRCADRVIQAEPYLRRAGEKKWQVRC